MDALTAAVFSDALIKQEQKLRTDITYLENRRFEANQAHSLNDEVIRILNGQISELKEKYKTLVRKEKQYIEKSDIFQVVLSQRFERKIEKRPIEIYNYLRKSNPSPFMFYFNYTFCFNFFFHFFSKFFQH